MLKKKEEFHPMHRKTYKLLTITAVLISLLLTALPVQADQTEDDSAEMYDLRMQYTEELIAQDAYNARLDYYESMEEQYSLRNQIVDFAFSLVGVTPYYPGGGSLIYGTDCSGFVFLVFGTFGLWLTQSSIAYQDSIGYHVPYEDRLPGDIIVYDYGAHVGIYAGYDLVVHCSSEENGTVCWPWNYRNVTAVVRVLD